MNTNNALIGALVADAAALGLHWLYDQDQIGRIGKCGHVLFRQPDVAHYEAQKGYFAQGARRAGQLSHYGESARIAALACDEGSYSASEHRAEFLKSFGPCGSFHGYADRPTKALVGAMLLHGDELSDPSGIDDDQMPGLCPVAAVFSRSLGVEAALEASSVISTNEQLLLCARLIFDCLEKLSQGLSLPETLEQAAQSDTGSLHTALQESLARPSAAPLDVAQHYGLACHVPQGMPVSWHILKHASSFEHALSDNVRCGGDSCGRAMIIGPLAALAFGVPQGFIDKLDASALHGII